MSRIERFAEAYLEMAKTARYRPAAPGDGLGNVSLSSPQLSDPERLRREARQYAERFSKEEDSRAYTVGFSNYSTNRALVYVIEAARSLCGADNDLALKLLAMAIDDIKQAQSKKHAQI